MVRTPVYVLPIRSESGKRVFPIPDICDAIAYGMEHRAIAGACRFARDCRETRLTGVLRNPILESRNPDFSKRDRND